MRSNSLADPLEGFVLGRQLYQGECSTVTLATHEETGEKIVVKRTHGCG